MQLSQGKTHAFLVFCLINVGVRIAKTIEETGEPWGQRRALATATPIPVKIPFPFHSMHCLVRWKSLYIYIIINVCEKAQQWVFKVITCDLNEFYKFYQKKHVKLKKNRLVDFPSKKFFDLKFVYIHTILYY